MPSRVACWQPSETRGVGKILCSRAKVGFYCGSYIHLLLSFHRESQFSYTLKFSDDPRPYQLTLGIR